MKPKQKLLIWALFLSMLGVEITVFAVAWEHVHPINFVHGVFIMLLLLRAIYHEVKQFSDDHDEDMRELHESRNPDRYYAKDYPRH